MGNDMRKDENRFEDEEVIFKKNPTTTARNNKKIKQEKTLTTK